MFKGCQGLTHLHQDRNPAILLAQLGGVAQFVNMRCTLLPCQKGKEFQMNPASGKRVDRL